MTGEHDAEAGQTPGARLERRDARPEFGPDRRAGCRAVENARCHVFLAMPVRPSYCPVPKTRYANHIVGMNAAMAVPRMSLWTEARAGVLFGSASRLWRHPKTP